jgi:hypothetical protein
VGIRERLGSPREVMWTCWRLGVVDEDAARVEDAFGWYVRALVAVWGRGWETGEVLDAARGVMVRLSSVSAERIIASEAGDLASEVRAVLTKP